MEFALDDESSPTPPRIAIIDDNKFNLSVVGYILQPHYAFSLYTSGSEALEDMPKNMPDLILLDIEMPEENGFAVIRKIKDNPLLQDIPVIFLTGMDDARSEARGLALGAVDFISKDFVPETILARINIHLVLQRHRKHLEDLVQEKTSMVEQLQDAIMLSLSDLVECRDATTAGHAQRTIAYVRVLTRSMVAKGVYADQLTRENVRDILRAAPLHDVGKVGISDAVLEKPGKLTQEEFQQMQQHTVLGSKAIQRAIDKIQLPSFLNTVRDMTLTHHERWDGKGYPLGLREEQIPLAGRIMAIADVYDALVSQRPYKKPFSHEKAVDIIREGRGTQFDPHIADVFLEIHEKFAEIAASTSYD